MIGAVASLLLTGFVSLLGQIVLLRELNVAFFGIELVYLIALGVWLLLTALGTLAGRRARVPPPERAAVLLLMFAVFLPLAIVFLRASRLLFGGIPGAYLPFSRQMAALVLALAPVGLLSGLLFRTAALLYAGWGRTLAGAYGIESAGALAGGLLATLGLRWGIQNFPLAVACSLVAATAALFLFRRTARRRRATAAVLATFFAFLLWQADALDRRMTFWNHPGLLATADSPYGRLTVVGRQGQVSLFSDDALAFETQGTEAELFAHLTALQHGRPRQILLIGGGLDGTVTELLQHRPARIDVIEMNPVLQGMVLPLLPQRHRDGLADPAVRWATADPRRYLREGGAFYDLILVAMPEPASGQTNRFYTREFFRHCAARLNPAGIVGLRLPAAENIWTPHLFRRTASIHRALSSVFPEVATLPGTTTILTASAMPLPRSADLPGERLRTRALRTRLVTPSYLGYVYTNDRRSDMEKRLREAEVPMNTDIRPACYPAAVLIWLSRFFPTLALAEPADPGAGFLWWLTGLAVPLLFFAGRLRPAWSRTLLAGAAGFLGLVLESVLLLAYQSREGVLYQDIGLLLMMFMAGLALGAWLLNEALRWTGVRRRRSRWWGVGLLAGFGILSAAILGLVAGAWPGNLPTTALLMAASGFLVSGIFAYAALRNVRDQREVVATLYAADLLGGCAGSLLGSLILIPFLGLDGTVLGMLLVAASALLLV